MNNYQIHQKAAEMNIPLNEALFYRFRYVREQMFLASAVLDGLDGQPINFDSEEGVRTYLAFEDAMSRFIENAKEQRTLLMACRKSKYANTVTEEEIVRARSFPIDRLIEFTRGKAIAPCHADNNPSLSHDRKHNRAHCFPCARSFNPIDYIMLVDGLEFPEAVRRLAT